tara:strand:- start:723 stop:1388 length:666 start_codon:yes stop_codon:yes gene_type:complete
MHLCLQNLNLINNKVKEIVEKKQLKTLPKVIAVTKTFPLDVFKPLLEFGHHHFGENKIQEAEDKWLNIKSDYKNLQLHMIGKLQSNKAKKAVKIFDYLHSLDNEKLAKKIDQYQNELNKKLKIFIQVNLGNETQKSGISLSQLDDFYIFCTKKLSLSIIGLMCLPPLDSDSEKYFKTLKELSHKYNLKDLSIGMSNDYENAVLHGSTFLRLGTAIFGERSN